MTFTTGSQVWFGTAWAHPDGMKPDDDVVVHGEAPAEVPLPDLFDNGKVSPARAAEYLAAAFTNSRNTEILSVAAYGPENYNPGFGVRFHNGARAFNVIYHVARAGQGISGPAYQLPDTF